MLAKNIQLESFTNAGNHQKQKKPDQEMPVANKQPIIIISQFKLNMV